MCLVAQSWYFTCIKYITTEKCEADENNWKTWTVNNSLLRSWSRGIKRCCHLDLIDITAQKRIHRKLYCGNGKISEENTVIWEFVKIWRQCWFWGMMTAEKTRKEKMSTLESEGCLQKFWMACLMEINGWITSHGYGPMDSVQVGKAVFVK